MPAKIHSPLLPKAPCVPDVYPVVIIALFMQVR